jgi:hypothetical protein
MDTRWFAIDEVGHVGIFDSGENGHVPDEADTDNLALELWRFRHPNQTWDDARDSFGRLEEKELADQLGVFIFAYGHDFDPIETYGVIAAPKRPLHVDQLPPSIRYRWKSIRFQGTDFSRIKELQPLEQFPCSYWYEELRVAYLASDGKTVRPIRGQEEKFAEFCEEFRRQSPELAAQLIFEGPKEEDSRGK